MLMVLMLYLSEKILGKWGESYWEKDPGFPAPVLATVLLNVESQVRLFLCVPKIMMMTCFSERELVKEIQR